jgi:hypothetical protein
MKLKNELNRQQEKCKVGEFTEKESVNREGGEPPEFGRSQEK